MLNNGEADIEQKVKAQFKRFILNQKYPCVMAQTTFRLNNVDFHLYNNFGSVTTAQNILSDLRHYIKNNDFEADGYYTFMAAFEGDKGLNETAFENLLWKQLQLLHEADDKPWDPEVSHNPDDNHFSFSLAGKAFYVVGLHPNSSRKARQSPCPALVFNLHSQFEKLKEEGNYHTIQRKIRKRDKALQGYINPMVKDFGEESEARQYSGRKVGKSWKCPFHYTQK